MQHRLILIISLAVLHITGALLATDVTYVNDTDGPSTFIRMVNFNVTPADAVRSVQFTIAPKTGSVTRAISATYSAAYLKSHNFLDTSTGHLAVPVWGLYQNYNNSVTINCICAGGSSKQVIRVQTQQFNDPNGVYSNPNVVVPRSKETNLSYDFILAKSNLGAPSPTIIDTDGEIRWVGTSGDSNYQAILYQNGIYVTTGTGITRVEMDGTYKFIADYSNIGVTGFHHNYDPGKKGILICVDTQTAVESTVIEIDGDGKVLKSWDLSVIMADYMRANGDDPSDFVRPQDDWFHNNANTYRKTDNTLILSSRENFVIAIDYTTSKIKWILGDTTKKWYEYPSLKKLALKLGDKTLPPIGQHAVSIAKDGTLLLFDDGTNSGNQSPAGENRDYSAPRKYAINTGAKTAVEKWQYLANPSIYSPYCSSVYEDKANNYLIDYTFGLDLRGIDDKGNIVFQYTYPANGCGSAWNAIPIHLEKLSIK
ncbi:MAG: aryl-sulfate sulfotransferase [Planctomycetota bacterium]